MCKYNDGYNCNCQNRMNNVCIDLSNCEFLEEDE